MQNTVLSFKALGDENRFRIVMMLRVRPLCVCEMLEVLDIAGSTLSTHLKILVNAGIIGHKKDGRWVEYFLKESVDENLFRYIERTMEDNSVLDRDRRKVLSITREVCSAAYTGNRT